MIDDDLAQLRAAENVIPADEVVRRYLDLAERAPKRDDIIQSLALFLMSKSEYRAAAEVVDNALCIAQSSLSYFIKARALDEDMCYSDAAECYAACLKLDPANRNAQFYLSLCQLTLRDFENGTKFYAARLTAEQTSHFKGVPEWKPDKAPGRVLLWAEQGIGDEVMFLQLLSFVEDLPFDFSVECDARLISTFQLSHPKMTFLARGGVPVAHGFDYQIPIGDLLAIYYGPLLSGKLRRPSLSPVPRTDVQQLVVRVKPGKKLVGLSWLSASEHYAARRSVPVELISRGLDPAKHAVAILQYFPPDRDLATLRKRGFDLITEVDCFNDVEGALALTGLCDAVVSIDNSVVHFAGALGRRTHILLPSLPNWRWGITGQASYWYPSVCLHRVTPATSWEDAVDEISI